MTRIVKAAALVGLVAAACAAPAAPVARAGGETAAKIGDRQITLTEVDAKAKATNMQAYQQLYDARRAAVEEIIADELLAQEAKRQGVSKEALIEAEITKKISPVTDPLIEDFYNKNSARMQGQPLSAMAPRIRQFLEQQNSNEAHQAYMSALKSKAAVSITLDPPRVDVVIAENDPTKGPANAVITLVEFSEFQ